VQHKHLQSILLSSRSQSVQLYPSMSASCHLTALRLAWAQSSSSSRNPALFCPTAQHWFLANVQVHIHYMLSPVRLSVCLSSATLMHPTQPVEIFSNISSPFGTLATLWHSPKISRRSSQGTPPAGGLYARGVVKYSDFGPIEGYIAEMVQHGR